MLKWSAAIHNYTLRFIQTCKTGQKVGWVELVTSYSKRTWGCNCLSFETGSCVHLYSGMICAVCKDNSKLQYMCCIHQVFHPIPESVTFLSRCLPSLSRASDSPPRQTAGGSPFVLNPGDVFTLKTGSTTHQPPRLLPLCFAGDSNTVTRKCSANEHVCKTLLLALNCCLRETTVNWT